MIVDGWISISKVFEAVILETSTRSIKGKLMRKMAMLMMTRLLSMMMMMRTNPGYKGGQKVANDCAHVECQEARHCSDRLTL